MKTLLIVIIGFIFTNGFAQNSIDLANVYWRTSPANKIENSKEQIFMNMVAIDFKLPIVLDDKNILIFGTEYQQTTLQSTNRELYAENFSSTALQIGYGHRWNTKSKVLLMSFTRLNSDFGNFSINQLQQGGLVLGTTARTSNFDWKYGMYYNAEFFGPMFVPLFGFNWKMNEKWRLKLVIPLNFELSYKPNTTFITGLRFDGVNASYRTKRNNYIDKADNNLWFFAEKNIGKNIWFHVKAGYSILRKYRTYEGDEQMNFKVGPVNFGDQRKDATSRFENGLSLEARFIYRLPLK